MALINQALHEINAKVVYFGPGLAGKSTNLKFIHGKLKPDFRGKLKVMNVQGGKMLFFDFTPPGESMVRGYRVRVHVYTISGANVDPAAWKVALKGADGIVFVADSAAERAGENRRSLEALEGLLGGYGLNLDSKPLVFQYNKSDRADAQSKEDLDRLLNDNGAPSFTAASEDGSGVLQTLLALVKAVLIDLRHSDLLAGKEEAAEPAPAAVAEAAALAPVAPAAEAAPEPSPVAPPAPEPEPAFETVDLEEVNSVALTEEPSGAEEALTLEISADVELAGSRLSVPLTVRSGGKSRSVILNLTVSLDQG
ncbi:GTP-binding protein [Geomesophilobacter sediminis]|uniref:GTPase domain-containing protein n=1 Tax=Geomesophilobacter sediminis TaxID=2798584 RepID=A0A8J7M3L9_9BACT|nr:GTPase domain-containing protein [Geomesophilobacter sediminis]MBJ6727548.1 GTPase domain-containing protein [Geomesophilobacter sediminis]